MNRVVREGLVVGFGASFGALVRFALTPLMASHPPAELLVTLGINVVGCFLMGLFDPPEFWGKGFLGGLTTFSAVSLASMQSSALLAAVYMLGESQNPRWDELKRNAKQDDLGKRIDDAMIALERENPKQLKDMLPKGYARPSLPLGPWKEAPEVYAGRDLEAGGTWLGIGPQGRFAALTNIRAIGSDLALDPGIGNCGKAGQWVPVGVGQPSLLIGGLTVGGAAA